MTLNVAAEDVDAILFDYGNTLIEFGPDQVEECDQKLSRCLTDLFGAHDFAALSEMQHRERRAPYQGEFIENHFPSLTRELVKSLYGIEPNEEQLAQLLQVRFEATTSTIEVDPAVPKLLEALSQRFRIGLISNYPDANAIRHSIERLDLAKFFDAVVVSGDIGHVKPHPQVFEKIVSEIQVKASRCLFIGDNWLGDIQGARRFGMHAIFITQFVPYEKFDREPDDMDATATIKQLGELSELLVG
jgi:HAD superfamily hydrolase (TIGR01549 family)